MPLLWLALGSCQYMSMGTDNNLVLSLSRPLWILPCLCTSSCTEPSNQALPSVTLHAVLLELISSDNWGLRPRKHLAVDSGGLSMVCKPFCADGVCSLWVSCLTTGASKQHGTSIYGVMPGFPDSLLNLRERLWGCSAVTSNYGAYIWHCIFFLG